MNQYFDESKISELFPGAEALMVPAGLIWKLPAGKEHMMSEVCESGDYFAEEKIDGAFYMFVTGSGHGSTLDAQQSYLFGRTVSKVTGLMTEKGGNVPHIMNALCGLPPQTALIGEIYYPGGTAKNTVTIMGCLPEEAIKRQQAENGPGYIHYYIHDIISYDGVNLMNTGAWDRWRILSAVWTKHHLDSFDFLRLARPVEHNIEDEVSRILASGGEGMVLKKRTAVYVPGKRPAWDSIKFKQMDDTDLVCTRVIPATREYTGKDIETWPYWEVAYPVWHGSWDDWEWREVVSGNYYTKYLDNNNTSILPTDPNSRRYRPVTKPYALGWMTSIGIGAYSDNGELVELGTVSSGLTDEDRANMAKEPNRYTGMVVSLHAMSIDRKEKTLRHPVFKSWREDKNPQDCTIKSVFS